MEITITKCYKTKKNNPMAMAKWAAKWAGSTPANNEEQAAFCKKI